MNQKHVPVTSTQLHTFNCEVSGAAQKDIYQNDSKHPIGFNTQHSKRHGSLPWTLNHSIKRAELLRVWQSRFIERFESVKQLTVGNLAALQAGYNDVQSQPTSPLDGELHLRPSPGATASLIKRKPLPDTAQKAIIEMRNETDVESFGNSGDEASHQNHTLAHPTHGRRPSFHRTNTVFTDFLPYNQVRTWQQVDNEEYQDRCRHSLSAIALDRMKKLNLDRDTLSAQRKKTANQLKKVIEQHILDKEKSIS
ncbi:hypothetical protein BKA58DRAFT_402161 [Alternaria rosae]|uniref:uncharacterized protein n=1 Tax=Alternaria rosae TaxID=1187941 RepID=UPI001E8ECFCA|nr:uncharacterized protein BKA58DRAFT_402161 [Alternaria rosae]KAH6870653.1 hypothetical protein BKA58DRAFT_402161 [Alternaria rosae]